MRPEGAREKNGVEVDGRDKAVNEYKREEEARCEPRTQPRMRKGRKTEKENMAADIRAVEIDEDTRCALRDYRTVPLLYHTIPRICMSCARAVKIQTQLPK